MVHASTPNTSSILASFLSLGLAAPWGSSSFLRLLLKGSSDCTGRFPVHFVGSGPCKRLWGRIYVVSKPCNAVPAAVPCLNLLQVVRDPSELTNIIGI